MVKGYKYYVEKKSNLLKEYEVTTTKVSGDSWNKYNKIKKIVKLIWGIYGGVGFLSLLAVCIINKYKPDITLTSWGICLLSNAFVALSLACILGFIKSNAKARYDKENKEYIEKDLKKLKNESDELSKLALVIYAFSSSSNYLSLFEKEKQERILGEISSFYGELIGKSINSEISSKEYQEFVEEWMNKQI